MFCLINAYFSPLDNEKLGRIGCNLLFEYSDKAIKLVYEATGDIQKTINRLLDSNFYSVGTIQNRLSKSITALKEKEKVCNIKISDYVESNYQKKRLFNTVIHPSERVMLELTERKVRNAF